MISEITGTSAWITGRSAAPSCSMTGTRIGTSCWKIGASPSTNCATSGAMAARSEPATVATAPNAWPSAGMAGARACTAVRTPWKNAVRPPWKAGSWRAEEMPLSPVSMTWPTSGRITDRVGASEVNA